jgi:hypothetical protein
MKRIVTDQGVASLRRQIATARLMRDQGLHGLRERPPLRIDNIEGSETRPEAMLVERVELGGLLSLAWATVWCRSGTTAPAGSPVPWDTAQVWPWVLELHMALPAADGGAKRIPVVVSWPCEVDPREPTSAADHAIFCLVARACMHEWQESVSVDGKRLDPHELGELGLASVAAALECGFGRSG